MFDDSEIKVIKFHPCIEKKRLLYTRSCQTKNIQTRSTEVQSVAVASVGIQVYSEDASVSLNILVVKESENLGLFLKNILPFLFNELQSFINDDLKSYNKLTWNCKEDKIVEINGIKILEKIDYKDALISSLTWNCNGTLLGVASSKKNHQGWCNHEMVIKLYSLNKNLLEKNFTQMIKSTSCIKQIEFHPFRPFILAGGFQNGEIGILDLKNVDVITFTKLKENGLDDCHNEDITFIEWRANESNSNLVTAGKDGKIFFWKVFLNNLTYAMDQRFLILQNNETDKSSLSGYLESLCVGFWSNKEPDFIVTADEKVFHCSLKSEENVSVSKYKNPVFFSYTPHKGIVTGVACLSQSNFFATCAMDGETRIYLSGKKTPIHLFLPKQLTINIRWIGSSNHLISWKRNGIVKCHKFNFSEKIYFSNASNINIGKSISALHLNPKRTGTVAFGCENGEVIIVNDFTFE